MEAWTVEFDDYTKDEYGTWSQVCNPHLLEIYDNNVGEVEKYIDEWSGSGVCGVKGCSRESEHYIDFK